MPVNESVANCSFGAGNPCRIDSVVGFAPAPCGQVPLPVQLGSSKDKVPGVMVTRRSPAGTPAAGPIVNLAPAIPVFVATQFVSLVRHQYDAVPLRRFM